MRGAILLERGNVFLEMACVSTKISKLSDTIPEYSMSLSRRRQQQLRMMRDYYVGCWKTHCRAMPRSDLENTVMALQGIMPINVVAVASTPPDDANRLLSLFTHGKDRESLIGDLEEEYTTYILPKHGLRFAKFWYWWHTLASIAAILAARLKALALLGIAGKVMEWLARKVGF